MGIIERLTSSNEVLGVVVASVITGIFALIGYILRKQPKIRWAEIFIHHYLIPNGENQRLSVLVKDIYVENMGGALARDIEVSLNYKPQHCEIYPHVPYSVRENPDGRQIFKFEKLNPGEFVQMSLHNIGEALPETTNVRYDGGQAKRVLTRPQIVFPKYVQVCLFILVILGFLTFVYLPVRLIQGIFF